MSKTSIHELFATELVLSLLDDLTALDSASDIEVLRLLLQEFITFRALVASEDARQLESKPLEVPMNEFWALLHGGASDEELEAAILMAIDRKPERHEFRENARRSSPSYP